LKNGISVEDFRQHLSRGSGATAPPPPPPKKTDSVHTVGLGGRDSDSLISKICESGHVALVPPQELTKLEAAVNVLETEEDVFSKKFVKCGEDQVLVSLAF
jgi:hypothetical protein